MEIAAQLFLNTVVAGALYALISVGFNLIYSTARFFDLSYGAIIVAGGYAMFYFYKVLQLGFPVSLVGAVLLAAGLGFLIEKTVYRPLRARHATTTVLLIASLGVLTVVQALLEICFTSQFRSLSTYDGSEHIFTFFGGVITQTQVLIIVCALVIMVCFGVLLRYTRFGKVVRAIADDEEVARVVGINTERVIGIVFFIGAAVAGVSGIAIGFDTGLQPNSGLLILLSGIIAVIIGGVGNPYGGVAGALLLALVENAGMWFTSGEWKGAIAFFVLTVFLVFRPRGMWPR